MAQYILFEYNIRFSIALFYRTIVNHPIIKFNLQYMQYTYTLVLHTNRESYTNCHYSDASVPGRYLSVVKLVQGYNRYLVKIE